MKTIFSLLVLCSIFLNVAISQNNLRGTIKVKKPKVQTKYLISKETSFKVFPEMRIFRVRGFNYNFKEYFPKEYNSELFPLVFNYGTLLLVDEKKKYDGAEILSFEYTLVKSNVTYYIGFANEFDLSYCIREILRMRIGSCVWIKNLAYKDKNGVVHKNEIGEFKVEKVM